jgi:hypothetical protein
MCCVCVCVCGEKDWKKGVGGSICARARGFHMFLLLRRLSPCERESLCLSITASRDEAIEGHVVAVKHVCTIIMHTHSIRETTCRKQALCIK